MHCCKGLCFRLVRQVLNRRNKFNILLLRTQQPKEDDLPNFLPLKPGEKYYGLEDQIHTLPDWLLTLHFWKPYWAIPRQLLFHEFALKKILFQICLLFFFILWCMSNVYHRLASVWSIISHPIVEYNYEAKRLASSFVDMIAVLHHQDWNCKQGVQPGKGRKERQICEIG